MTLKWTSNFRLLLLIIASVSCSLVPEKFRTTKDKRSERTPVRGTVIVPSAIKDAVISSTIHHGGWDSQRIEIHDSSIDGTAIEFPPGSLGIDTQIDIQEGAPLANVTTAIELGIKPLYEILSPTILIQANPSQDAIEPFSIQLPIIEPRALRLQEGDDKIVVLYRIKNEEMQQVKSGLIPNSQIHREGNFVRFSFSHFGSFQAVYLQTSATDPIEVSSEVTPNSKALDTTPPTVNVGADITKIAPFTTNATVNGGETYLWTQISGPGTITFASAQSLNTSISADLDGIYVLRLSSSDAAGNIAFDELTLTWDSSLPIFTSLNGINAAADGVINSSEYLSPAAAWELVGTGYSTAAYTAVVSGFVSCNGMQTYSRTTIPAISDFPAQDGPYAICVKLTDGANNTTYGKSQSITRDITPPVLTSLKGANEATDGYITVAENSSSQTIVALVASDYVSASYSSLISQNTPTTCDASITYSLTAIPAINSLTIDGLYALCVKLVDASGNITYGKSDSIRRLSAAPPSPTNIDFIRGNGQLTLSWTSGGGTSSGYTVIRTASVTGTSLASLTSYTPSIGTVFTTGQSLTVTGITDTLKVVYDGSSLSAVDASLTNDTRYHYLVMSYDAYRQYSAKVLVNAEPKSLHQILSPLGQFTDASLGNVDRLTRRGNYLYVSNPSVGVGLVDISNRTTPIMKNFIAAGGAQQFVPYNDAYGLIANGTNGLSTVNTTDPNNLTLVTTLNTPGTAKSIAVFGSYALVADDGNGLLIISLTDPTNPSLVQIVSLSQSRDVVTHGSLAYVANGSGGLVIVDLTNPASPVTRGTYNDSNTMVNADALTMTGNRIYLQDSSLLTFFEIDVTNPDTPTLVQKFYMGSATGVCTNGARVYTTAGADGLHMWEIDTTAPAKLVSSTANGTNVAGDCVVVDEYVYTADAANKIGLFYIASANTNAPAFSYQGFGQSLDLVSDSQNTYIAMGSRALILNVTTTTPAAPTQASQITAGNWISGVTINSASTKLFLADGTSGLKIYDITSKTTPALLGSTSFNQALKVALNSGETHAFVSASTLGLKVIDITNPALPTAVSALALTGTATDIEVVGSTAYVAVNCGLRIVDISTPASPVLLGTYDSGVTCANAALSISGNTGYLIAEGMGLRVLDISVPASITELGSRTNLGRSHLDVRASGNQLYIAGAEKGLTILDIANPAANPLPTLGQYNTYGYATRVGFVGGGYVFVASDIGGLSIIQTP